MSRRAQALPATAVWFVTGTSSGMGLRLLETILSNPGYRVVATSRNPKTVKLPSTSNESNTLLQSVDLKSEASIAQAFEAAVSKFGRIDVVINNAGYGLSSEFEGTSVDQARDIFEINFWAPAHITRQAMQVMRDINPKNGSSGGVIAQVSSIGGWITSAGLSYYHATKFALEGLTETIAKETDPSWGIKFAIFEPGAVDTNWRNENMAGGKEQHKAYRGKGLAADQMKEFGSHISKNLSAEAGKVAELMVQVIKNEDEKWDSKELLRLPIGADAWSLQSKDIENAKENLTKWQKESESTSPGHVKEALKLLGGLV